MTTERLLENSHEWQVWIWRDFSFIINERPRDCFEHDFMQFNGCCVLDSFPAPTWWRIYYTLSPCAVLYYLRVSRSHTHLLLCISDASYANNAASGCAHIPTLHPLYSACLCSKWNWNSEKKKKKIVKPPKFAVGGGGGGGFDGGCRAQGGDGDDVGWDERDAKSSKCRKRRNSEGVHGEQGGRAVRDRVMMQEKTGFRGTAGWM